MPREVEFCFERAVSADELLRLFAQAKWASRRTRADVEHLLHHSAVVLGGWRNGELVAFARALTDDRFRALIDDVIVDASCRGQGIGTELMRRMAERLAHVEEVFLRCDAEHVAFYERLGYTRKANCLDLVRRPPASNAPPF
jgi:ribosomal protein S18 acetylase RimI-like enzyme